MQTQDPLLWDDAPLSLSDGFSIKHHALLYSKLIKQNPLSGISTYEFDIEQTPIKTIEQLLDEANS